MSSASGGPAEKDQTQRSAFLGILSAESRRRETIPRLFGFPFRRTTSISEPSAHRNTLPIRCEINSASSRVMARSVAILQ
jgi:hypothetical protein